LSIRTISVVVVAAAAVVVVVGRVLNGPLRLNDTNSRDGERKNAAVVEIRIEVITNVHQNRRKPINHPTKVAKRGRTELLNQTLSGDEASFFVQFPTPSCVVICI